MGRSRSSAAFAARRCSAAAGPEGDEISIRLGSLDEDPQIRPQFHTYVASRAPWDELPDDGLPRYDAGKPGDP